MRNLMLDLLWKLDALLQRFRFRSRVRIRGHCIACGDCCRRLALTLDGRTVHSESQFEVLLQRDPFTYSRFQMLSVDAEGDLLFRCSKLGDDGLCTVHASRPPLCRQYPDPRMFLQGARLPQKCSYEVFFPAGQLH